ncbi:hypothetical protein PQC39_gp047 [Vibrio phage Vp_R1]|uniref:Uncharacterized protein n=1 Tax=Vibrio phage Vp_R1 TaxID=2059867 RepID=A0A2H5BPZ9_9CAUD|nr:hypothetical protein PQC39_gp047 [Vibrio phage Vp_R1]AUG88411.1 hypothetical protein VPR_047 [Vibrio phage Vp_R1]
MVSRFIEAESEEHAEWLHLRLESHVAKHSFEEYSCDSFDSEYGDWYDDEFIYKPYSVKELDSEQEESVRALGFVTIHKDIF